MDLELIKKLDELITIFENSEEIKKLQKLKKEIYDNNQLKEKMEKFNKVRDNIYDEEYLKLKKEILNIDMVKEYKKIENDLYLLTLAINRELKSLISSRDDCNENN